MLYKLLLAENQKVNHTFTAWFTVIGATLLPTIYFIIYFSKAFLFIPEEGVNPWTEFFKNNFNLLGMLFLPLFVVLVVGLNVNTEFKANSWKKLFVLPVKKEMIFVAKLLFLIAQLFITLLIFCFSLLFFGVVLGLLHPELGFLKVFPDFVYLIELILRLFVSVLGMLSIQYFLCLYFENIMVSISIGAFAFLASLVLVRGWEYAVYDPYAFTQLFSLRLSDSVNIPVWSGVTLPEILSVVYFLMINWISIYFFKRKVVK